MEWSQNRATKGVPRWACPWAAGWTGMDHQVHAVHALPKNSLRRIQRVGVTATSFAATVWLLALVWIL